MEKVQLRIVIVDDNQDALTGLGVLTRKAGFSVVDQIREPTKAMERIAKERPHVVLLDIGMPLLDGYTLARRIRAEIVPPPRLVAITGYGSEEDKQQAKLIGFDAHFTKPIEWLKLELLLLSYANSVQASDELAK
jgi:CheY-like chemotaxis protein